MQERSVYVILPAFGKDEQIRNACLHGRAKEALRFNSLRFWRSLPDLDHPVTFCEKLQWLKLYDSTPIKTMLADKYLAKKWIAEQIGDEYNVPLLGVWDRPEEIDFDALPERYVLKTNHSWRTIVVVHGEEMIVVEDRQKTDRTVMKNALRNWLQHDFAFFQCEYHYHGIPKKIVAEVCLPHIKRGSEEYKFLCINGKVFCIHAMNLYSKDGGLYTFDEIYSPEWKRFSWKLDEEARDLYNLVLKDIQELAEQAMKDADAFYQRLSSRMERRYLVDASQTEKERKRLETRNQEIDGMFLSLYTDKAKGILTEQRFMKLTAALEQEQEANQKRLHDLAVMQSRADAQESEVRTFIKEIRRYATIEELDEAVLNRLISRILIGEVKKVDGQKVQEVRIVYNFVGEIPEIAA